MADSCGVAAVWEVQSNPRPRCPHHNVVAQFIGIPDRKNRLIKPASLEGPGPS